MSSQYPTQLDTVQSLIQAINDFVTELPSAINDAQTVIPVSTVAGLPSPGVVSIDSEIIYYTSTQTIGSTYQLIGCTRGFDNTVASPHLAAARVEVRWVAFHHNHLASAVANIEAALGLNPQATDATVADRISAVEPLIVTFSPPTMNWSFTHTRKRIVAVQLYRKMTGNQYELFEANIEQIVDTGGVSQVNITLGGNEEGYAVVL